jgi:hypothetical protein
MGETSTVTAARNTGVSGKRTLEGFGIRVPDREGKIMRRVVYEISMDEFRFI